MRIKPNVRSVLSLSPLIVFLAVYLVSSLVTGDFYKIPVGAAFLVACIWALLISEGSLKARLAIFSRGAGDENIMQMIWIFVLAGAFASTAEDIGAIDATVGLVLKAVPKGGLYVGLFLTACIVSLSIGTSVGTIVTLIPIAGGIASEIGAPAAYVSAIIVGGAFFGDNLSFISDTTIASTRAAGCGMRDKFKANLLLVLPAVVIVSVIYIIQGAGVQSSGNIGNVQLLRIVPYALVLVLSLCGLNVMISLLSGLVLNAVIGLACGSFSWSGLLAGIGEGIAGMSDLIIVTLLAGGMMATIRAGGGISLMIRLISKGIRGRRGAEASIAALVSVANLCTANNTIAILTVGGIAKEIADRYGISPKRCASLLDTFSCIIQGIIPYGAQLLMAASLTGVAGVSIIRYLYYPMALAAVSLIIILIGDPRYRRA